MSLFTRFANTLSNPRVFYPLAASAGTIGLAYQFSSFSAIRNESGKTFTGGDEWLDLTLKESSHITHDTKHYIFELKDKDHVSGLTTASCLLAKYVTPKGNNVIRPYTPISDPDQKGTLEFIVKTYENGKFSKHFYDLKVNDTVSFKGPIVKWKWEPNQYKNVALIGGGSGITPLYQLVHEITKNPEDKTKVQLFYGSLTKEDIILKKELDEIASKHKDQFSVQYFLNKADDTWEGHTGFITKDYLKANLPEPSKDVKIFVCGPPGLYDAISGNKKSPTDQGEVTGALADLGYTKEHVFKF